MRISKQSVGAWVMLGGFLTTLIFLNWVGFFISLGVQAVVLAIDLYLDGKEEKTISQWIWYRFNRVQGWLVLIATVLGVAIRIGLKENIEPGLLPACLAGQLSVYLIIGGHSYWDERDEDKEPK